ncbi:MAG: hypothetical protein E6J53_10840 [Chloroflexi bacterium]|nr:MAG: hypothetical protein E6J53_10840 [Chloroflexota bacterium]
MEARRFPSRRLRDPVFAGCHRDQRRRHRPAAGRRHPRPRPRRLRVRLIRRPHGRESIPLRCRPRHRPHAPASTNPS